MKVIFSIIFVCIILNINCFEENVNTAIVKHEFKGVYEILIATDTSRVLSIDENNIIIGSRNLENKHQNFRIVKSNFISEEEEQQQEENAPNIYQIEEAESNKRIGVSIKRKNLIYNVFAYNEKDEGFNGLEARWYLKQKTEDTYYIQNELGCYLQVINEDKISCNKLDLSRKINDLIEFRLVKLYENAPKESSSLLEREPIDVLIKYIDLSDETLVRDGIQQIIKDEDHEELRYSLRSVLKNIPWIRKIFILMPNQKVKFLKEYDLIKEKIVYVKDKDLLGFDSASSPSFQFNLWRMKDFGMSDNFILMDDDCFIGKPLKKMDFFYEENGNIYPSIISEYYTYKNYSDIMNYYESYEKKKGEDAHTHEGFMFSLAATHKFIYDLLGKSLVIPNFTHNAIPANLKDLLEIFTLIKKYYPYANDTLFSLFRNSRCLQCQSFVATFTLNKYMRKVHKITARYIDVGLSFDNDYNSSLYCINTGGNGEYSRFSFIQSKAIMEKLFPEPTIFEVYNYSLVSDLCFEILNTSKTNQKSYYILAIKSKISLICNILEFGLILFVIIYYKIKIKKMGLQEKKFIRIDDKQSSKKNINIELKIS